MNTATASTHFTDDNTEGYTAEQLELANEIVDDLGISEDEDATAYHCACEKALKTVEDEDYDHGVEAEMLGDDEWGVLDIGSNSRWTPDDAAMREIVAHNDPGSLVLEICAKSPGRGTWQD